MAGIDGVPIIGAVQLIGRQNPNGDSGTERELFMQTACVTVLFTRCREGELRRCPGGGTCLGPARRLSNNKHSRPVGGKPSIGAFFGLRKTSPILQCPNKVALYHTQDSPRWPPGKRAIRTNLSNNG